MNGRLSVMGERMKTWCVPLGMTDAALATERIMAVYDDVGDKKFESDPAMFSSFLLRLQISENENARDLNFALSIWQSLALKKRKKT